MSLRKKKNNRPRLTPKKCLVKKNAIYAKQIKLPLFSAIDLRLPPQVYMYHPPPHANLTVRLEADKTSPAARQAVAGRTWEEVGKWEVRVADHHCSQHWFLEKHRFTGPEGAVQGLRLRCDTETAQVVPVAIKSLAMPAAAYYEVVIAGIILLGVYTLIIFELVPRTLVAMIGATVTVCVYSMLHERPSIEYIVTWIDYETVCVSWLQGVRSGWGSGLWATTTQPPPNHRPPNYHPTTHQPTTTQPPPNHRPPNYHPTTHQPTTTQPPPNHHPTTTPTQPPPNHHPSSTHPPRYLRLEALAIPFGQGAGRLGLFYHDFRTLCCSMTKPMRQTTGPATGTPGKSAQQH